jgi:acyl carrier protein
MADPTTVRAVIDVLAAVLELQDRAETFDASTELYGSLPELDSLAVVELVQALEEDFQLTIEDSEFSGELFETVGSLANFVESKNGAPLESPGHRT